jgi:hypothetical protein
LGLLVGPLAWAAHHQFGSNWSFAACGRSPQDWALLAGLLALSCIVVAGWLSWRVLPKRQHRGAEGDEPMPRFVPLLSVMSAALFGATICMQLLADLIVPPCFG